jgi:transposase
MPRLLVEDALWSQVEPLLPPPKLRRRDHPGRKPLDNRKALTGILFVLKTGIAWRDLPSEMGCGCGVACWRRLHYWHECGVWEGLKAVLLAQLRYADQIDWSRAAADCSSIRALKGGDQTGPNPTDRARSGSKHHVLTDGKGTPLSAQMTAANANEVTQLLPLADAVPPVAGKPGHPRQRPEELYADRAYDSQPHREELRRRGIKPRLARKGQPHGSGLGIYRWVSERTLSWFHQFKRLRIRYERTAFMHEAFLSLACCLIIFRQLAPHL